MSPIYLKEDEVKNLITVSEAINILESGMLRDFDNFIKYNPAKYK